MWTVERLLAYARSDEVWPPADDQKIDKKLVFAAAELWEKEMPLRFALDVVHLDSANRKMWITAGVNYVLSHLYPPFLNGYNKRGSFTDSWSLRRRPPNKPSDLDSNLEREALVGARLAVLFCPNIDRTATD
jgi:hypothetical protein